MIIDETFHQKRQGCYELIRVHQVDGNTVRIRVYRDSYDVQSHAVAEVLTPDRTWTAVASTPATQWHESTPLFAAGAAPLTPIADALLQRARRILSPPEVTTREPAPAQPPAGRRQPGRRGSPAARHTGDTATTPGDNRR